MHCSRLRAQKGESVSLHVWLEEAALTAFTCGGMAGGQEQPRSNFWRPETLMPALRLTFQSLLLDNNADVLAATQVSQRLPCSFLAASGILGVWGSGLQGSLTCVFLCPLHGQDGNMQKLPMQFSLHASHLQDQNSLRTCRELKSRDVAVG
jgi:hypothetical protein